MHRSFRSQLASVLFAGAVTLCAAAAILLLARPVHAAPAAGSEDARLAQFFETSFQRTLKDSPMLQSYIGQKGADYGKWDDISEAEQQRQDQLNREDLKTLHAFDMARLSARAQVDYRIFEYLRQQSVDQFPWRHHLYVFSTNGNPASELVTFLRNVHAIDSLADAEAYVARIRGAERYLGQAVDNAQRAARAGIVPTSFSFAPVLGDARTLLHGAPFEPGKPDHPLLADLRAKLDALKIGKAEKERVLGQASDAIRGPFRRGVEGFIAAVEKLQPLSKGPHGAWALPDGEAFYRARAEYWTTDASLDPKRLHELGLAEVERLRGEMQSVMRQTGFKGDLPAFFAYLRTDPSNFFPDTDAGRAAYLAQSKAYIDNVYSDVERYFHVLPKAPLEVRRVESWREATAPIASYEQPTPDGSRPGIYYVNLHDMKTTQKHEMETVAYHEGAPGHHFQTAIQMELSDVPAFEKYSFFGAYVEGWGLYAERLAKEQGRFTDPLQDFGRLQNEMLRAARLVVDTGGHAMRWTREQMIDYMLANSPMTREDATKEVERYLDDPGQALSYKVGMLKLLELRERERAALGPRFDLRAFHDVVLKNGALPLPVLEQMVDAQIAGVAAGTAGGAAPLAH